LGPSYGFIQLSPDHNHHKILRLIYLFINSVQTPS